MSTTKLRKFAQGQPCTLRLPGICNFDPATTVLCHIKPVGFGSMATKPNDIHGVHACSCCHEFIDGGYVRLGWTRAQVESEVFRALYETQERAVKAGLIGVVV